MPPRQLYRSPANRREVRYLNTDLEIESKSDLSKIVEEFGEDVIVLYHGEIRGYQHASFEIAGSFAVPTSIISARWWKDCQNKSARFGMGVAHD
jgi:hypothetical protein